MEHGPGKISVAPTVALPLSELRFRTSRSSGPGGQNVNKLETRVELLFDLLHSPSFRDDQKIVLIAALGARVDAEGILHIISQASRSQWENKQLAIDRLVQVLRGALKVRKKRVKTAPSRASKARRVDSKKKHSQKKKLRKVNLHNE
jgi:ribosome-associated protein